MSILTALDAAIRDVHMARGSVLPFKARGPLTSTQKKMGEHLDDVISLILAIQEQAKSMK